VTAPRRACVGLARADDAPAINALRRAAYGAAPEFRLLRPELLDWDPASPDPVVVAGWNAEGALVATFQALPVADAAAAAAVMGVACDLPARSFPGLIKGRAATARGVGRSGLNSVLRWHLLLAAIAAGYRCCLGLAYADAPRLSVMESMGYDFHRPAAVWDPEVEPLVSPLVCHLPATEYARARAVLAESAAAAIAAFPWAGPPLVLPLVVGP
jgi:hypothetical protein